MEEQLPAVFRKLLRELFVEGDPVVQADLPIEVRDLVVFARSLLIDEEIRIMDVPEGVTSGLPQELHCPARHRWNALLAWHRGDFGDARDSLLLAISACPDSPNAGWHEGDLRADLDACLVRLANSGDETARNDLLNPDRHHLRRRSIGRPFSEALGGALRTTLLNKVESSQRSPHAIAFGSTLPHVLDRCADALSLAVELASVSLVSAVRSDLALVLHELGAYHGDAELVISAVSLYMLEQDEKRVTGILKSDWQLLFRTLSSAPLRFVESLQTRTNALDLSLQCSVLEKLGPYVPESSSEPFQRFVFNAFDFDSERGFHAVAMRKALAALAASMALFDQTEALERLIPLLSGHPVVIQEALDALYRIRWEDVPQDRTCKAVAALQSLIEKPLPGPGPFRVLQSIRKHWPSLTKGIEDALVSDWREDGKEAAILYFSQVQDGVEPSLRTEFAARLLDRIEAENRDLRDGPLRFGGHSKWGLLSGFLLPDENTLLPRVLEQATRVVTNASQAGHTKAECIDVMIWLYDTSPSDRERLVAEFIQRVLADTESVLSVKRGSTILGYSKDRLKLKLHELSILGGDFAKDEIIRDCVRFGLVASVDTRAETIRVLSRLVDCDETRSDRSLPCLLLARTYDQWDLNAGDAAVALSRWATRSARWKPLVTARLYDLLEHGSSYARSSAIHAAALLADSEPGESRLRNLVKRGLSDPHKQVRDYARRVLDSPGSS